MNSATRSARGRIVGYLAAAVLVFFGLSSFALVLLLSALILAAVSAYLGWRYDRERNRLYSN